MTTDYHSPIDLSCYPPLSPRIGDTFSVFSLVMQKLKNYFHGHEKVWALINANANHVEIRMVENVRENAGSYDKMNATWPMYPGITNRKDKRASSKRLPCQTPSSPSFWRKNPLCHQRFPRKKEEESKKTSRSCHRKAYARQEIYPVASRYRSGTIQVQRDTVSSEETLRLIEGHKKSDEYDREEEEVLIESNNFRKLSRRVWTSWTNVKPVSVKKAPFHMSVFFFFSEC
ncbi:unnamed protein product [Caenorhabditis auriculariae]|uniref:Uncharacterized protein n=1 Tax=Caenorhabditis auriculariae TaxID=2777116 RepID=A0A8S1HK26_9PELO|nr:unnamed protein product [Caenorhabditis auriculariae]